MYKQDDKGRYQIDHAFIDTWVTQSSGLCLCEVRLYESGERIVHRSEPVYLTDMTRGTSALFTSYNVIGRALMDVAKGKP